MLRRQSEIIMNGGIVKSETKAFGIYTVSHYIDGNYSFYLEPDSPFKSIWDLIITL